MSAVPKAPMKYRKAHEVLSTYDMSEDNTDTEFKEAIATALIALNKLSIAEGSSHGKIYSVSYEGVIELRANSMNDAMAKVADRIGFIIPHNEIAILDAERAVY